MYRRAQRSFLIEPATTLKNTMSLHSLSLYRFNFMSSFRIFNLRKQHKLIIRDSNFIGFVNYAIEETNKFLITSLLNIVRSSINQSNSL